MKKRLLGGAIALASLCPYAAPASAKGMNIGCQNILGNPPISNTTASNMLNFQQGMTYAQLVSIAHPTCTLLQIYGDRPGEPEATVFAYALKEQPACYLRAELRRTSVTSIRIVCP